jgi:hypothetical protein
MKPKADQTRWTLVLAARSSATEPLVAPMESPSSVFVGSFMKRCPRPPSLRPLRNVRVAERRACDVERPLRSTWAPHIVVVEVASSLVKKVQRPGQVRFDNLRIILPF